MGLALSFLVCTGAFTASAQGEAGDADQAGGTWTLRDCIDYAREHNIQIKTQEVSLETAEASLEQARAAQYPTLSFSTSFGANFRNISTFNDYLEETGRTSMSNNFGLNSGMALYQGGRLRNTVRQQQVQRDAAGLGVEQAGIDIEISVTQAYLQMLYNREALLLARQTEDLSARQVERGEQLFAAGSISRVELAQLKSQHASDGYKTVSAENTLETGNGDFLEKEYRWYAREWTDQSANLISLLVRCRGEEAVYADLLIYDRR